MPLASASDSPANAAPAPGRTGKYLLVTSDDFGMCHAVNTGITRAMAWGVLRSTNLMAPCPWFPEATHLVKTHGLKTGVHLCLTSEWDQMRWSPVTRAPSLTGPDGYFYPGYAELARTAKDDEIFAELEAQIGRVRAAGIEPTHADSHMLSARDHRDCVLRVKAITREVCRKHGLFQTRDHRPESGFVHLTDQFQASGETEERIWNALEGWTRPGVYELITHAAEPAAELEAVCRDNHPARHWAAPYRIADLVFLTSLATRQRIADLGFELIDAPTFKAMAANLAKETSHA